MPSASSAKTQSLASQMTGMAFAFFMLLMLLIVGLGWWAVVRIDERALARQTHAIHVGFEDMLAAMPVDVDSAAVWDDAVVNAKRGDGTWLAENLVEWLAGYYRFDRVYLLDSSNNAVRATISGDTADLTIYDAQRSSVEPLVLRLRDSMREASLGLEDSTGAVTGLGESDRVVMPDGTPAIVTVRPIVPSSDRLRQTPGSEFLLMAVRDIGEALSAQLSQKFSLADLIFARTATPTANHASTPILDNSGRIVGFFNWTPDRPAWELVASAGPVALGGLALALIGVLILLRMLRRTSTKLEVSEAHAQYLAFHDSLTGVPNRALFEDRLERALAGMRRSRGKIALHYIDLDRFKHVNDTLGHPAGDALIQAVALRLSAIIRESDTIARLGGDEFAVVQVDVENDVAVERLCEQIIAELSQPFELSGCEARVGASIGVVLSGDSESTPSDMMRRADIALYEAKANGRGRYQLFAGDMDDVVHQRRQLEQDLRTALSNGEGLKLVYQPIFDANTGAMVGAEALARWEHPTRGLLAPDIFIGLAEERGLIELLGSWVLRTACQFAVQSEIPWVAVNVSPLQFRNEHFADRVFAILKECNLPPRKLEIEITEGLLLQNSAGVQATLLKLRAAGIRIALDDFGTGYSSISYLRHYGVDKLKIDRSFVEQLGRGSDIDSIVLSIIQLARAMKMKVTAEGVETEAQRDLLIGMKCDQLQGYLLSRPSTGSHVAGLLPTADRMAS